MKIKFAYLIALLSLFLSSCNAVGAIFKTGVWVGVLGVVFIIGIVLYLVGRAKK